MRKFIDIVSSHITEGRKENEQMINPVVAGTTDKSVADELRKGWSEIVREASRVLSKEDRIVWYLRYALIRYVLQNMTALPPEVSSRAKERFHKKMGFEYRPPATPQERNLLGALEHYLSMPITDIQSYRFDKQPIEKVIDDFDRFEDEWRESLSGAFYDEDYDASNVVIDFKNGWYWINTQKAYCSKEAEAMGHCGNSPRSHTGDKILSLRKKLVVDGEDWWEPHLTFILDNGQITEMKGKGNDKPAAKYHDMIIALLLNPIIEGIRGGGYLPQNNFSLSDLPDNERDALLEKKPELADLRWLYDTQGFSKAVKEKVYDLINDGQIPSIQSMDSENVVLQQWADVETFFRHELSHDLDGKYVLIGRAADGDFDDEIEWLDQNDDEWLAAFFDHCADSDNDLLIRFLRAVEAKFIEDGRQSDGATLVAIMEHHGIDTHSLRHQVTKRAQRYAQAAARKAIAEVPHRGWQFGLEIDSDGSVEFRSSTSSFIEAVLYLMGDGDEDDMDDIHELRNANEWFKVDDDRFYELTPLLSGGKEDKYDELRGMYNPYSFASNVEKIAIKQVLLAIKTPKNPNQYELDL